MQNPERSGAAHRSTIAPKMAVTIVRNPRDTDLTEVDNRTVDKLMTALTEGGILPSLDTTHTTTDGETVNGGRLGLAIVAMLWDILLSTARPIL